jgi:hypothetical protein
VVRPRTQDVRYTTAAFSTASAAFGGSAAPPPPSAIAVPRACAIKRSSSGDARPHDPLFVTAADDVPNADPAPKRSRSGSGGSKSPGATRKPKNGAARTKASLKPAQGPGQPGGEGGEVAGAAAGGGEAGGAGGEKMRSSKFRGVTKHRRSGR